MRKFLLLFLCITSALAAEIIDTMHMRTLETHLKKDTVVVFDIDNTIMETAQELGNDQWFHHQIGHYQKRGYSTSDALEKALAEWMAIQNVSQMQLVEDETKGIIASLQERGYTVMGLTTRGLGLSTRTVQQLASLGVDLSLTAPTKNDVFFDNNEGVLFRRGILFTAGSHKGTAFEKLMDSLDFRPKRVIFINDKRDHIEPVEKACLERKIEFLGLRYGYLDEKVAGFRADLAEVQFEHFGHILSNEEAEKALAQ